MFKNINHALLILVISYIHAATNKATAVQPTKSSLDYDSEVIHSFSASTAC